MPYETPLHSFALSSSSPEQGQIVLSQPSSPTAFVYTLTLLSQNQLRVFVGREGSEGTMEGALKSDAKGEMPRGLMKGLQIDETKKSLTFTLVDGVTVSLNWSFCPVLTVLDAQGRVIHRDLNAKGYCFEGSADELAIAPREGGRVGGISHYSALDLESVCMGLGEKAAPVNLSRRRLELRATNAALYDAYHTDPLYKHLPFLLIIPNPAHVDPAFPTPPFVQGLYTPSNAAGVWDLGCEHNDPLGDFKKYTQTEGALDLIISWAPSGREVKTGWRELMVEGGVGGVETLVPRQWLGYLASTMGQAESDNPPAQELLREFPEMCEKWGIPCSAMHLSSGYTVDPKDGFRKTFNWNNTRYPDFEGLMRFYHERGLKVCANIKPYVSHSHPHYPQLRDADALFRDPLSGRHSSTQVWSGLWNENSGGSWVDMTSLAGRHWWATGVADLVRRGIDSTWNDDNEFTLAEHNHTAKWEMPEGFSNPGGPGPKQVGLVGTIVGAELMGQVSKESLEKAQPGRRVFVLTRSANVGSLSYVTSSWSGDNFTSWKNFRGEIAMGLNAGLSFLHTYGDDVGGFGGPLPTPELFLRWVQSAVWRSRFCIHSFKPTKGDRSGGAEVNSPWMYPEVVKEVREAIERRYELLPYLYALSWEAATTGEAPMTWLGWGEFEKDKGCFEEEVLEGQDFWVGTGRVLVAGAYHAGVTSRRVYLPTSGAPNEGYYDLSTTLYHPSGSTITTPTPLSNIAIFVRSGTILPIGKPMVTLTSATGLPATTADGTDIQIRPGLVELDDFRGCEIYPPPAGSEGERAKGSYEWNEDDGESHMRDLKVSRVRVEYESKDDGVVEVKAKWVKREFEPLWAEEGLWVVLPKGDTRAVRVRGADGGEVKEKEWRGRKGWMVPIE